jgi:hypothetical protein
MLNDDATLKANTIGFSIMVIYVSLYVYFASPREKSGCLMKLVGGAAFVALAITYSKVALKVKAYVTKGREILDNFKVVFSLINNALTYIVKPSSLACYCFEPKFGKMPKTYVI